MAGAPRRAGTFFLGLTLALAGCLLLPRSKQEPRGPLSIPFNHKAHIEEAGLDCTDCHAGATKEARAGYPAKEECAGCHESGVKDGGPQAFEVEINGLADPIAWPTRNVLPDFVVFSHARHATAGADCKSCHGDVGASTAVVSTEVKVDRTDCADCHEGRNFKDATWPLHSAGDCRSCHVEGWGKTIAPPSHEEDWLHRHGNLARAGFFPDHGKDCASCHREESCTACHRAMTPDNHNTTWRERSHGVRASADRDACAVCHTQDTCARCHAATRPSSHRASWGEPSDRHCLSCHADTLGDSSCAVCHVATPGHDAAPKRAAREGHNTDRSDCRTCHITVPHPDEGGACERCH